MDRFGRYRARLNATDSRDGRPDSSSASPKEGELDPEPLPQQVPLEGASNSAAGPLPTPAWRRMVDTAMVVVAPIFISIIILAASRVTQGGNLFYKLGIGEFAIAITGIAFASATFAWTKRAGIWEVVMTAAVIIGFSQAFFVTSFDSFNLVEKLVESAAHCVGECNSKKLGDLALAVMENNPSWVPWSFAIVSGAALSTLVCYSIWKES